MVFDKQPYFLPIGLDGAAKCLLCEKVFKPPNHVECRACGNVSLLCQKWSIIVIILASSKFQFQLRKNAATATRGHKPSTT